MDLKVAGTEEKEFLDGYLDGKRLYESHGFPPGFGLVSIFRMGWQKQQKDETAFCRQ